MTPMLLPNNLGVACLEFGDECPQPGCSLDSPVTLMPLSH